MHVDRQSTQHFTPALTQRISKMFECAISFTVFCPSKNKRGKKTAWVALQQPKGFKVKFDTKQVDDWDSFRHLIAEKCSTAYKAMYQLLEDSPPSITWSAYILRNSDWAKGEACVIDEDSFSDWITAINNSKGRAPKGGVVIEMENPSSKSDQARKSDLLTQTVRRNKSQRPRGSGTVRLESEPPSSDEALQCSSDEGGLRLHMDMIYEKYAKNVDYDPTHLVYLHPTDQDRYVVLTLGQVEKWAIALRDCMDGVSLDSPPDTVKWESRKATKRLREGIQQTLPEDDIHRSQQHTIAALSSALAAASQAQSHNQQGGSLAFSVVEDTRGSGSISDYLDFVGVAHNKEQVLEILLSHDIDQYHLFHPSTLSAEKIENLGLSIGTVAKLQSNVCRYMKHLSLQD
ncbi:hypothetical protein PGTUg99_022965 [Puccinia graminis f. sp. tritici]|nr:hypothetical protein PGTUg99_022965 [Puccinia graminis f. sp. tritici]